MTVPPKRRYELELAAAITDSGLILAVPVKAMREGEGWAADDRILAEIEAGAFAQVEIIHETGDAVYVYQFHLIEHLASEPVMLETVYLTTHIEQVHADYGEFAQEITHEQE